MDEMNLWERVRGHDETVDRLRQTIEKKRPAHAYLFYGPPGVGKALCAKTFAAALVCRDACGSCPSCRGITGLAHPDFHYVAPEGSRTILREQIIDLTRSISLKRQSSPYKTAVIDEAQDLGLEAANALLKTLEEPPDGVVFILVAHNTGRVLPTIASRCRRVAFGPLGEETVADILTEEHGLDKKMALVAARLAKGRVGEALELAGDELLDRRAELAQALFTSEPKTADMVRLPALLVRMAASRTKEIKAEHDIELVRLEELAGGPGKMPAGVKNKVVARHRRELTRHERGFYRRALSLVASLYRDLLIIRENADKRFIANYDLASEPAFSAGVPAGAAENALAQVEEARRRIEQNVHPQLAFENLFYSL